MRGGYKKKEKNLESRVFPEEVGIILLEGREGFGIFIIIIFKSIYYCFPFFFNADNIIYYSTSFDLLAVCFSYLTYF